MEKINLSIAMRNLKKNFLLLISTVAFLCLFLSPSLTSLLMTATIFIVVLVLALLDFAKSYDFSNRFIQRIAVLIAILIALLGYNGFKTTWTPSSKVAILAKEFHLTTPILLFLIGLVGCVVGFYAMYVLSYWIVIWTNQILKEKMLEQKKTRIIANLKKNWYFPISAMAFFCLSISLTLNYFVGLLIAFIVALVVASQIPSILDLVKKNCIGLHVVAIMTALGICWGGQASFYINWSVSSKAQVLEAMLPIPIDIPGFVSIFGAVVAIFFVYFCILIFWKEMARIISESGVFNDINIAEWIVYGTLIIVSIGFVVTSFVQTEAFYGTEYPYDIIYTSDSPSLVKGNVYLALTYPENDLRQPLFAVFAAPFIGIPYLLGKLFGTSASVQAILINSVQVVMLFSANFMLTKMMKLSSIKRICFMILTSFTYTHLLFILMMEQYIVAYFWLIFCLYLISEKQRPDQIALWGAGGTLLTSMILLPFMSVKSPIKDFKEWFFDMMKYGWEFVIVILAFCRFDVIFNLITQVSFLVGFTGYKLTMMDKFCQYTVFVRNCFIAPNAGVSDTVAEHISWQLNTAVGINFTGIVILLFIIVSIVVNRDQKSSLLAASWVAFSMLMLLVLGWGTKENGLILYALYFGWAFFVLLFQLVEKIENKMNVTFLTPILSLGCTVALAVVNIPAIIEMVNFAITYFPV